MWKALSLPLLMACSGGPVSMQRGQWESTTVFSTVEYAGVAASGPDGQAMRAPQTGSQCISAEDAADPIRKLMEASRDDRCRFVDPVFADGVILLRGFCREDDGGSSTMNYEGTYGATEMSTRVTIERTSTGAPGHEAYRLAGTMTSRRTGDCPAGTVH